MRPRAADLDSVPVGVSQTSEHARELSLLVPNVRVQPLQTIENPKGSGFNFCNSCMTDSERVLILPLLCYVVCV